MSIRSFCRVWICIGVTSVFASQCLAGKTQVDLNTDLNANLNTNLNIDECEKSFAGVNPRNFRHPVSSFNGKYTFAMSIADIEQINNTIRLQLEEWKIPYREVAPEQGVIPRFDEDNPTHPLSHHFKLFEILGPGFRGSAKSTERALIHPELSAYLVDLKKRNVGVFIDPSLEASTVAGFVNVETTELRISRKTYWHQFRHEHSHVLFHEEILKMMDEKGYFDELKTMFNHYQKNVFTGADKQIPFSSQLEFGSKELQDAKDRAFLKLAQDIPEVEYQRLIKEKNNLGYAIAAIRQGFFETRTLQEASATSLEADLLKEDGFSRLNVHRLQVEHYRLQFMISELSRRNNPEQKKLLKQTVLKEILIETILGITYPYHAAKEKIRPFLTKLKPQM